MVIFIKTRIWLYKEEKRTKKFFYWNQHFKTADQKLFNAYFFKNPYQISRKYLQKQGAADLHTYGETPITTMRHIVQECGIAPHDHVLEMGAGRGRTAFFLNRYVGCTVHAIERIPEFVETAQEIASDLQIPNLHFSCSLMEQVDMTNASVIYLYGSCLSDLEIQKLTLKFELLLPQIKIITVSYPLSDYSKKFITTKQFSALFPWGTADVYLNKIIN